MSRLEYAEYFHFLKFSQLDAGEEPHRRYSCLLVAIEMAKSVVSGDVVLDPQHIPKELIKKFFDSMTTGAQEHCRILQLCESGDNHRGAIELSHTPHGDDILDFSVKRALAGIRDPPKMICHHTGELPRENLAGQIRMAVDWWWRRRDNKGLMTMVFLWRAKSFLIVYQVQPDVYAVFDSHPHCDQKSLICIFPARFLERVLPHVLYAAYPDNLNNGIYELHLVQI